jgi:hypothetical protein
MTQPIEKLLPATDEVNRAQRDHWTDEGQRQYQQYGDRLEAVFAPFGQAMLDAAGLQPGERVLDVGAATAPRRSRRPSGWRLRDALSASTFPPPCSSPPTSV